LQQFSYNLLTNIRIFFTAIFIQKLIRQFIQ
jgi:hypothetical protein